MTDREKTMVEEFESEPGGAGSLAAATLAMRVADLLQRVKHLSGVTHRALANSLGITQGRVSQVLNGDGNVHVATLARFMHAMGYEIRITAEPIAAKTTPVGSPAKRTRERRPAGVDRVDLAVYEQTFLTGQGVAQVQMFVPTDDVLGCTPEGDPRLVGRVRANVEVSSYTTSSVRSQAWQTSPTPVVVSL